MLISSTSHAHQAIHLHPAEGWSLLANFGVKRAKAMMNEGERKIFSIAESLGYENIYYFSKVFKKVTGETPSQYLKKLDNM